MGLGLLGIQHAAALEPFDRLKGPEMHSNKPANGLSRETWRLMTNKKPVRAENAQAGASTKRLGRQLSPTGS